ncbi:MAG TPA: hypothetical protein VLI72_04995 [Methylibium sp.]|nr:hypothetical protein [Methylibium sp.]
MTNRWRALRRQLACGLLWLLAGWSGGAWAVGSPGFLIDRSSVTLSREVNGPIGNAEIVRISQIGSQVGAIGAAYREGIPPASWLAVALVQTDASNYALELRPATTGLPVGTYRTTLSVGSVGLDLATLLGYYDIAVTLVIAEPTVLGGPALDFTHTIGTTPGSLTLTVAAPSGRAWTVGASRSWIRYSPTAGSGAGSVDVSFDPAGLAPGSYSGQISVTANGVAQSRTVSLTVVAPTLSAAPATLALYGLTGGPSPTGTLALGHTDGAAVDWSATTLPPWLRLSRGSGRTPDSIVATAAITTARPGSYDHAVLFTDAHGHNRRVPVTVSITGPVTAVSPQQLSFSGTNGAPLPPQSLGIGLSDGSPATWTASSPAPWLRLGAASGSSSTPLSLSIDAAGPALASGSYQTQLTITVEWEGRRLTTRVPVSLALAPASLQLTPDRLTLGGTTGRNFQAATVTLQLDTGGNSHPWTLTGLPDWLSASVTSGVASGTAPVQFRLKPDRLIGAPGTNRTTLTLTARIHGDVLRRTLPVAFRLDEHRLLASAQGVALTRTPLWGRLTRSLTVTDNFGFDTAWSASSDQPWLAVSRSGRSGDALTMRAFPAGLALDRLHFATITIAPQRGDARPDTVRVGFWVGSATPREVRRLTGRVWREAVPDPVRPLVYAHDGGSDLLAYNVYTGLEAGRVANVAPSLGSMTVAGDGGTLYVVDTTQGRIVPVILDTLTAAPAFALPSGVDSHGVALQYGRVNGTGILLGAGNDGHVVDGAALLKRVPAGISGRVHAFSADGRTLAVINRGLSPYSLVRSRVDYSAAGGGTWLASNAAAAPFGSGSNGKEVAVADNRLYAAAGSPYEFSVFDSVTAAPLGALPGDAYPAAVKVASDGRVFAAAGVFYGPTDLWVYRADGTPAYSGRAAGYARWVLNRQFWPSGDALIGIALTDDPAMVLVPVGP